ALASARRSRAIAPDGGARIFRCRRRGDDRGGLRESASRFDQHRYPPGELDRQLGPAAISRGGARARRQAAAGSAPRRLPLSVERLLLSQAADRWLLRV